MVKICWMNAISTILGIFLLAIRFSWVLLALIALNFIVCLLNLWRLLK